MSRPDPSFGYAQARQQSRFGMRPGAADWRQLEATRDLGAVLQLTRDGPLGRWTGRMPARPGVHEIERRLREVWLDAVDEVANWQPESWSESVRWLRWIVFLPALQKLARGGRAPAWMRADPTLGPIVAGEPRERPLALARTPLVPLAAGFSSPPDVPLAWVRHWQTLWPVERKSRVPVERLLSTVRNHLERLATAPASSTSRETLQSIEHRFVLAFRRQPLSPVAAVAYVGLLALDFQRLHGALAIRALRDGPVPAP
jgi:hypothetical protein